MVRNFTLYNFGSQDFFIKALRLREKSGQSFKACDWSISLIQFLLFNWTNRLVIFTVAVDRAKEELIIFWFDSVHRKLSFGVLKLIFVKLLFLTG
jgi:hypothetical protein